MKNEKGFTLSEIIAVFAILAIMMLVALPNFNGLSKKVLNNYDSNTSVFIKNAAKMYVSNNKESVDNYLKENERLCIPIAKLISYEYLDSDLKYSNGEKINDRQCVNVSIETVNEKTKYVYDINSTDMVDSGDDIYPPVILLKSNGAFKCDQVMNESLEYFYQNCYVESEDDTDYNTRLGNPEITYFSNKVFLKYTTSDSSGNEAIPLTITLITDTNYNNISN